MDRLRSFAAPALRVLAVLVPLIAAVACWLAWERVEVRVPGDVQARSLDGFHGSGLAACVGAALALLMLADALLRPRPSQIRVAGVAFAGALLVVGAVLFTSTGGYRPASGEGYSVSLQPGLFAAGIAGLLLVLSAVLQGGWRRGGSRSPASSG
ncbi:MAG TPA: hypothetical protein VN193_17745 [Candidatus Angelobacter sp.]|nr:hypothetical protein [Candidatus Angelobacter sp.]